jgi:hypothetical protein
MMQYGTPRSDKGALSCIWEFVGALRLAPSLIRSIRRNAVGARLQVA